MPTRASRLVPPLDPLAILEGQSMDIHRIRNDADLTAALARVDAIWGATEGTPEADELEVLAVLIEAYETKHYPIGPVEPVEFLKAFMEHTGRTQPDLAALFGSAPRASEILNKRQALTVEMIHRLASEWKIPAEALVSPYSIAEADEDAADVAAYDAAKADLADDESR